MTVTNARKSKHPLTFGDLTPREQMGLRTAVHESSHAIVGTLLGGRVRSAVLSVGRMFGVNGLTTFEETARDSAPLIAYAGPYGEARWLEGGRHPSQRLMFALMRGSGGGDHRALCAAAASADVYGTGNTSAEARRRVPPLLDRAWPAVINLAQVVHREGEARHEHVLAALGITDGGGPGSSQLASLKAGLRRVPPISPPA
ncbi:hypothetical protein [Mycolicibacterium brisbanense]|uniref:Peptidase M41 domain-containing protein n=1 Tax=Mycolicibacterium brisbanense TaxID=146020 RepID=A0A100W2J2_9MYCO|nr:hypothetical protein [Mycolicibacterium brisbanense]MCV7158474.1 hypothetical protein [Mycolicibacterium brisbanense]GAS90475.1 uncharacterized protein RMCB_4571 [Mycolicibacterium brisbanense]